MCEGNTTACAAGADSGSATVDVAASALRNGRQRLEPLPFGDIVKSLDYKEYQK
jgi:hypothetical protein